MLFDKNWIGISVDHTAGNTEKVKFWWNEYYFCKTTASNLSKYPCMGQQESVQSIYKTVSQLIIGSYIPGVWYEARTLWGESGGVLRTLGWSTDRWRPEEFNPATAIACPTYNTICHVAYCIPTQNHRHPTYNTICHVLCTRTSVISVDQCVTLW